MAESEVCMTVGFQSPKKRRRKRRRRKPKEITLSRVFHPAYAFPQKSVRGRFCPLVDRPNPPSSMQPSGPLIIAGAPTERLLYLLLRWLALFAITSLCVVLGALAVYFVTSAILAIAEAIVQLVNVIVNLIISLVVLIGILFFLSAFSSR